MTKQDLNKDGEDNTQKANNENQIKNSEPIDKGWAWVILFGKMLN